MQISKDKKVLLSCLIGNSMEWYEFTIYGFLSGIIGELFFPSTSKFTALIASFGVFAAGFLMRPVGALLFGYIGDNYGRKKALALSIILMSFATVLIAVLPTSASIGVAASVLLVTARILQGLSIGGEFTASMVYTIESSPEKKKKLYGSIVMMSAIIGAILAATMLCILNNYLTYNQLHEWGWRVAFGISFIAGIVGFYIRYNLEESKEYVQMRKREKGTIKLSESFAETKGDFISLIFINPLLAVGFFIFVGYMPNFLQYNLNYSIQDTAILNMIALIIAAIFCVASSIISSRCNTVKYLIVIILLQLICIYPLFSLFLNHNVGYYFVIYAIYGMYVGAAPDLIVNMFPVKYRMSSMSFSHNISMVLFGSTAPLATLWLYKTNYSKFAAVDYLVVASLVTLLALLLKLRRDVKNQKIKAKA